MRVYKLCEFRIVENKEFDITDRTLTGVLQALRADQDLLRLKLCFCIRSIQDLLHLLRLCSGIEVHRDIVCHDLIELEVDEVVDRILEAESGDQERSTSRDTDDHHPHSFLEAEDVSRRYLMEERQTLPKRCDGCF